MNLNKNEFNQKLISIRRKIHSCPELGGQEYKTAALIEKELKSLGLKPKRIAKTGVIATLQGRALGKNNKCIALRADMDALPITEQTAKPYASKTNGVMHACGHDANTTMVLGAVAMLKEKINSFSGKVRFIFQPNEEQSHGALSMIKDGALKNPKPNAIIGVHISPWLKTGTIGLKKGAMMAAVDKFEIEIIGDGGHGAYPHLGKDAIMIAAQVVNALQMIVAREIDPVDSVVITIGKIEGGERFNVLCGSVKMVGTVRTLNEKTHKQVRKEIEKKLNCVTKAFGARYKFKYEVLGSSLINSSTMVDLAAKAAGGKVAIIEQPSMGGEDFAEYLKVVPGCFVYIGAATGNAYPWHHEKFDIDEKALVAGAEFLNNVVLKYLG